jgi:2-dehydropantoate 2-reductase
MGSGAVGGVLGGRLYEHGHEVVLIARGDHLEALTRQGLRLESPHGAVTLSIPTVASPSAISFDADDVVVLAVKGNDTSGAIAALADAAPYTLPVVCAQNGVDNERVALRSFSYAYGMTVMCPTTHLRPGVVQAHSAPVTGIMDLGRWPQGSDDLATALAAALSASTFESVARHDIARWKWGKLLMNVGNAAEAICGESARSGKLARRARQEAVICLEAAGIDYVDREEDAARRGDLLTVLPVAGEARRGSSSWQSLARGSGAIEADYLNGEIVLLGRLHGVPTPANVLLQQVANRLARERKPPGSISEDELMEQLS